MVIDIITMGKDIIDLIIIEAIGNPIDHGIIIIEPIAMNIEMVDTTEIAMDIYTSCLEIPDLHLGFL